MNTQTKETLKNLRNILKKILSKTKNIKKDELESIMISIKSLLSLNND